MHFDGRGLFNSKVDASHPPFDLFWVVFSFAGCTFPGWIKPNKTEIIRIMGYKLLWGQWILGSQT
jgi:hypothetical protein